MVSFRIGKTVFVGQPIQVRGKNTVVLVAGVRYTVPTADLHPFEPKRKGG